MTLTNPYNRTYDPVSYSFFNLITKANFKKIVSNYVRLVTKNHKIEVRYSTGKKSFTDGKTITISSNLTDKTAPSIIGLSIHESMHIAETNMELIGRLRKLHGNARSISAKSIDEISQSLNIDDWQKNVFNTYRDVIQFAREDEYQYLLEKCGEFINIVEDMYIDALAWKRFSGWRQYYESLYNDYFGSDQLSSFLLEFNRDVTIDNYVSCLLFKKNNNCPQDLLPDIERIWDEINAYIQTKHSNADRVIFSIYIFLQVYNLVTSVNPELKRTPPPKSVVAARKLLNGTLEKKQMSVEEEGSISRIEQSRAEIIDVGSYIGNVKVVHIKKVTPSFIEEFGHNYGLKKTPNLVDDVNEAIQTGRSYANNLRIRNEKKVDYRSRLISGKIDRRLLNQAGCGQSNIFKKELVHVNTPYNIHISIDQSCSMDGFKFSEAVKFAASLATISKLIENFNVTVTVRSSYTYAYIMTIFDSEINSIKDIRYIFSRLSTSANTPEGLTYDVIHSYMNRTGINHFINICDGQPYFPYNIEGVTDEVYYCGQLAMQHTRKKVTEMLNNGINVTSLYMDPNYDLRGNSEKRDLNQIMKNCFGKNYLIIDDLFNGLRKITEKINKDLQKDSIL